MIGDDIQTFARQFRDQTHCEETHQRLDWAHAARDRLLGFTGVEFFDDLPNKVRRADQDSIRGHVLSNGIDANGGLIAFVHGGRPTPRMARRSS